MKDHYSWYQAHGISREIYELSEEALRSVREPFMRLAAVREKRQLELLSAFFDSHVSETAFTAKTGYGYDDAGREQTEEVFARVFGTEDALVRHQFGSGTQVLATCLKALLGPGDDMLIVTGKPYDSLLETLGTESPSPHRQSLVSRGVSIRTLDLLPDGKPDLDSITNALVPSTRLVYIQKSRGYSDRPALRNAELEAVVDAVRRISSDPVIFVDHCYCEFVEEDEPPARGADVIAGSLIKNPGSGIAPCGGYVAGRKDLVEEISQGMTAVGVGRHVGPSLGLTRELLQGLYFAPSVVASAMQGAIHLAALFQLAGYFVTPGPLEERGDIVQLVRLSSPEKLEVFCQAIQSVSPVDSYVTPVPAPMPGYDCDVIMASGSFIQGSTIELSADGPLREPFDVFVQGGLTFENARLGAMKALEAVRRLEKGDRHG